MSFGTSSVDPNAIAGMLRRAAEECILPRFKRLAAHEVREKSPGDLVTAADLETERLLTRLLTEALPGSVVVGEEAVAHDRAILFRLGAQAPVWVIDPVDGTQQFAQGRPEFAVIVALVAGAEVRAGWIHDPIRNRTVAAEAGAGTWRLDAAPGAERLRLPAAARLDEAHGVLLGRLASGARARDVAAASNKLGRIRFIGSSGQIYMRMVEGELDYAFFTRALPWDHAAGWLIHDEAGGHGRFLDGDPYTPLRHRGPLLFAADAPTWRMIGDILARG